MASAENLKTNLLQTDMTYRKVSVITFLLLLTGFLLAAPVHQNPEDDWVSLLNDRIERLDEETPGNLGVYIKDLGDDRTLSYNSDRYWYLASTIKIPVAIAVLQKVEEGELSLDDKLTLRESDFVDGSGDLLWQEPGTEYTVRTLITKMLRNSDSTATDMLIRLLGEEEFNLQVREAIVSEGLEPITTILQVRYEAYGEMHENAENLTNMDFIRLKGVAPGGERLDELLRMMSAEPQNLNVDTIEEAFERYYERGLNSGKLTAMGILLERLMEGELLSETHTELLLEIMEGVTTGDRRIKAGLPEGTRFAHKTGTQVRRACNVGIVEPEGNNEKSPVVVAACVEKYDALEDAEQALRGVGEAITEAELL